MYPQQGYPAPPGPQGSYGSAQSGSSRIFMATYQYQAQRPDELSFMPGTMLVGTMLQGPGWYRGYAQNNPSRQGLFPATHVARQGSTGSTSSGSASMNSGGGAPNGPALPPPPMKAMSMKPSMKPQSGRAPVKSKPKAKKYTGLTLKTRYAVWGSFLAIYGGLVWAVTGGLLFAWSIAGTSPPFRQMWGTIDFLIAAYCAVVGLLIAIYEYRTPCNGKTAKSRWLIKGLLYLGLSLPGYLALPTAAGSAHMLLPVFANIQAYVLEERYVDDPKYKKGTLPSPKEIITGTRRSIFGTDPASRSGRLFFLLFYVVGSTGAGLLNMYDSIDIIENTNVNDRFTLWVPIAKFFGGVMNVNFTVLFIPVSRTFITRLYSESSKDQTQKARTLRSLLKYFPLDQSLEFHMMCGKVGIFSGVLHTVSHVLNFVYTADLVWNTFGIWIWITGVGLLLMQQCFLTSVQRPVRRGHTELFWYNHYLFVPFVVFCILHGKGFLGPNYWKWILIPGGIYMVERILRYNTSNSPCTVFGATFMQDKVVCLRLSPDKMGPFKYGYKIGQYAFLNCPHVSKSEWHPFTISSAPEGPEVTFHIRVQGKNSWTWLTREYLRKMKAGANGKEIDKLDLERVDKSGTRLPGKVYGPDGKMLIRVYGPISAPTQHLTEYQEVVVCASGIGVTPLSSAIQSIVLYRWKKFIGKTYPDRANFCWVCSFNDIASFRWFIVLIKHAQDAVYDYANKRKTFGGQGAGRSDKHFVFHIFMTSMPKEEKDITDELAKEYRQSVDNPTAFWGEDYKEVKGGAPFTPFQLYSTMKNPQQDITTVGHNVFIHKGRPKWDGVFSEIAARSPETDIGVTFCGNPMVGKDLSVMCEKYTKKKKVFHMHKEVF